jgi:hypothetical protein
VQGHPCVIHEPASPLNVSKYRRKAEPNYSRAKARPQWPSGTVLARPGAHESIKAGKATLFINIGAVHYPRDPAS